MRAARGTNATSEKRMVMNELGRIVDSKLIEEGGESV